MKDVILRFSGSLTIGQGDVHLHNMVRKVLNEGYKIIVLDLSGVDYMDSSAVGELAAAYTSSTNKGSLIALAGLQPKIKTLLGVMCFLDIFKAYETPSDALEQLRLEAGKIAES